MAENEIKIKIEDMTHQQRHEVLKADYAAAKEAGATSKIKNSDRDWAIHSEALEELLKIEKPTAEEMRKIVHEFRVLQDILTKLGNAMSPVSEKTKKVIEQEKQLTKEREEAVKKAEQAESILARKKGGELGLKNKYIEENIKGLTYSHGPSKGKQVSVSKFLEMGATNDFTRLADATRASGIFNQLKTAESTAKTDITESNAEITRIDGEIAKLNTQTTTINPGDKIVINANKVVTSVEKDFADRRRAAQDPIKAPEEKGTPLGTISTLPKQNSSLGQAFKQFTLYAVALRALKSALREAVSTVKELDKSLTEQAMVTGKTRKETYDLIGSYQELALQTGATTKEIASVATEYMKQGKSTKDALVLTEAAVKAAKVARVSVGDSVNYLTTALNGFRLSAEQAMLVSDKFAAVAAASASDYDELAIALSKVASQANLAGMSIDYTTALLTKGLETTREAPETMGTALKTIIARMREMKDYGETLAGDTNINNVESQLAYVGIELKNQRGELRSTEAVLDELGKKWDTLNKNQQAALAKALAGTRQQSRLIAMMDGYERVTELQEIAQRSAGATAAQAGTYLEGMEATMNKIQVAWEKIVTAMTDSELIIGVFNEMASALDLIGNILNTTAGQIGALTTISLIALNILGTKIQEQFIAEIQNKNSLEQRLLDIKRQQDQYKYLVSLTAEQRLEKQITEEDMKQLAAQQKILDAEKGLLAQKMTTKGALTGGLTGGIKYIGSLVKNLSKGGKIGLAIAGIAAVGYAIYRVGKHFHWWGYTVKEVAQEINKLSNEIYKLNEKANAIKEVDRKFSDLDDKVIKTSKDVKEMNELLDSAKDKLTDAEKQRVNQFKDPKRQMEELRKIQTEAEEEANKNRQKQLQHLKHLTAEQRHLLLIGTDSDSVSAQAAIRAIANNELYQYLDGLEEEGVLLEKNAKATEKVTQAILDQMSAEEVAELAEHPEKIRALTDSLKDLEATTIFTDDNASVKERVQAFKDIQVALTADEEAYNKFAEAFAEWDVFKEMSDSALEFIDVTGLSIDQINKLFSGYKSLQKVGVAISKEQYQDRLTHVFEQVNSDFSNFNEVIEANFADLVSKTADGGKQWTALINTIGDEFSTSVLDMGQDMEKFKNTISAFYDKSMKWGEMKESEKSQFISDYQDLFQGPGGDELLKAFESGDYGAIESAIAKQMGDRQVEMLAQVNRSLAVEMARPEAEQNKAYIRQLQEYKEFLEDKENLYKVSLKVELEQEKKQIDEYKSYLQDKQKALEESLDKRKEAYQDYFDTINEAKELQDYEDETQLLISNIGKLGADNNASTAKERAELAQKLQELEKQHAEEMRQKAQDDIMKNLDKEVEDINKKFDKLLESNQALLMAMRGDLQDPSKFIGGLLSNKVAAGLTGNELQSYVQELQGTYGNILGTDTFKGLEFNERNGDLFLNVNGQEIMLNQNDQQSVFEAITGALRAIGHY